MKDFESILTVNHPYRFRNAIVDLARSYTPETMQVLAEEYTASSMAADIEDGRMAAADDLLAIESIFDQIGEMFDRIEAFRKQIEARVRSTLSAPSGSGRDSSAGPATWRDAWMPYCGTAGTTRRQSNGA
nr:Wadjet anti-phage system protein JetA family protein [Bradyrhizobium yuanmingense]